MRVHYIYIYVYTLMHIHKKMKRGMVINIHNNLKAHTHIYICKVG